MYSDKIHGLALDLVQNSKLKRVEFFASSGEIIWNIQNDQTEGYVLDESDYAQLNKIALEEKSQRHRTTIHLPSTIQSLSSFGKKDRL
jgi:hypothetical protein